MLLMEALDHHRKSLVLILLKQTQNFVSSLHIIMLITVDCMFLSCHVRVSKWIHVLQLPECLEVLAQNKRNIWNLSECNRTQTHNHLVHKWTLDHLAKTDPTIRLSGYRSSTVTVTDNSYLIVNWKKVFKFKADNKNFNFPTQFCLRSISNGFSPTDPREVSLNGNVYKFSINYNSVDKSDTLNIHKYLMNKNKIK